MRYLCEATSEQLGSGLPQVFAVTTEASAKVATQVTRKAHASITVPM